MTPLDKAQKNMLNTWLWTTNEPRFAVAVLEQMIDFSEPEADPSAVVPMRTRIFERLRMLGPEGSYCEVAVETTDRTTVSGGTIGEPRREDIAAFGRRHYSPAFEKRLKAPLPTARIPEMMVPLRNYVLSLTEGEWDVAADDLCAVIRDYKGHTVYSLSCVEIAMASLDAIKGVLDIKWAVAHGWER